MKLTAEQREGLESSLIDLAMGGKTLITDEQAVIQKDAEDRITGQAQHVTRKTTLPDKELISALLAADETIGGPQDWC
jgi:hypothetical protein